ncbi:MAG: hypothetical protein CFH06_01230 [Alphaproteobacteria bacterium MarineAlpha3_Bin5]|nr:nucleotide pyrophosphatase [Magnetovibrio sp.]PPR77523.1 MAG: hypothetical protein CFH06_01230 [Alphaproteobacteria bacterium MarineAlpha3_Bin5]
MKRVVLLICDGLRADMVRPEWTPHLCHIGNTGRIYLDHRSVFPSTTRTTVASIATGCHPGRHGLEGNCVALNEGAGLTALSAGHPDFRERMRKATGATLRVPTLSQRLAKRGRAVIFSNVSPGAAHFHDPDGYGYVYHRSGSFGPGLVRIEGSDHLNVSHDIKGDNDMTARFCSDILKDKSSPYSVLWLCEPDHTQHASSLGSKENLAVIAATDRNAGKIARTIDRLNQNGQDILLIVASDHGHQTVSATLPLNNLLVEKGLKRSFDSSDVVVASNGFSANIYLSVEALPKKMQIIRFLRTLKELDGVYSGNDLSLLGQNPAGALTISVTTKNTLDTNKHGIKGMSIAVDDPLHEDTVIGCGQHGGLGKFEQNPFLIAKGTGFLPRSSCNETTSAIDLAPTVLDYLGEPCKDMDGRPLSRGK